MRRWLLLGGGLVVVLVASVLIFVYTREQKPKERNPVVAAAGDIARCGGNGDEETADLLGKIEPGTVLALGDEAYPDGSASNFANCYDPSWGRFKSRTRPVPGNHEYEISPKATAYFHYFGNAAGDPGKGYYSYNLGGWHIVALNSNCDEVGGCDSNSPQVRWLKADLDANSDKACTLAYFHHPLFNSGKQGEYVRKTKPLWEVLYAESADLVLSGHDHDYQRFAPQTPDGKADPKRGIREFVVGTGGGEHYEISPSDLKPNTEAYKSNTYGVLELTLYPHHYGWKFVPVAGKTFTDSGRARCH